MTNYRDEAMRMHYEGNVAISPPPHKWTDDFAEKASEGWTSDSDVLVMVPVGQEPVSGLSIVVRVHDASDHTIHFRMMKLIGTAEVTIDGNTKTMAVCREQ